MKRIQRKRTKGYKQPDGTKYVGRPSKHGNPFKLTGGYIMYYNNISKKWANWSMSRGFTTKDILELYEQWIKRELYFGGYVLPKPPGIEELRQYKYLSCFCPLSQPCHADILIKLLNK